MLPALRVWDDRIALWWLSYLIATSWAISQGRRKLTVGQRWLVALCPALLPVLYIAFQVFVLGRSISLSSMEPDNPRFWLVVAVLALATWLFAFVFSYSRTFLEKLIKWLASQASKQQISNVSGALNAMLGVLGGIGLLVAAVIST